MNDPHVTITTDTAASTAPAAPPAAASLPSSIVIVDLGEKKRKQIKQLRKGRGKLFDEVSEVLKELQAAATIPESAQPVILIVKEGRDDQSLFSWLE